MRTEQTRGSRGDDLSSRHLEPCAKESTMTRGRPKRQHGYLRAVTKTFLEGTRCRTPEHAVQCGLRSLEEWTDALFSAKEAQTVNARATALNFLEPPMRCVASLERCDFDPSLSRKDAPRTIEI